MSWKAGLRPSPKDDEGALMQRAHALRMAKDSAMSRIRQYKETEKEENFLKEQELQQQKNWRRDRFWENEKVKTEEDIHRKSSVALLRDVLSWNLQVTDLLGDECEVKWKELSYTPTEHLSNTKDTSIPALMARHAIITPSSMAANQFLIQALTVTDPLLLDSMMSKLNSDQDPMGALGFNPLISPRAKLMNRIHNVSSIPGTPMVLRSGPATVSQRLIDSVFLAGPKRSDVLDLLSGQASDLTPTSIYPVAVGRSDPSAAKKGMESNKGRPSSLRLSGAGMASGNISGYALTPDILYLTSQDPDVVTDILPSFCFPNGIETTVTDVFAGKIPPSLFGSTMPKVDGQNTVESIKPKYFVFQLTGNNHTQFGVCMRFPRRFGDQVPFSPIVYTSYCICLVTSNPLFLFLFDVLAAFLNTDGLDFSDPISGKEDGMLMPQSLKYLDEFAMKLLRQSVPQYGRQLSYTVTVKGVSEEVNFQRRMKNELSVSVLDSQDGIGEVEGNYQTLEWALPVLLAHVPLKEILFVLGCMLTEMKVVVKCKDIGVLSACVMGLLSLMRPLSWSCPYIIILPDSLRDYLDSPVPLVVGVVTTPATECADYLSPTPGMVVIDVNMKKVNLDPADVVYSHTLKLPHTDTLLPKLRPFTEVIANITRQRRRNNDAKNSVDVLQSKEVSMSVKESVQPNSPRISSSSHNNRRNSAPFLNIPPLLLDSISSQDDQKSPSEGRRNLGRMKTTGSVSRESPRLDGSSDKGNSAARLLMKRYSTDSIHYIQDEKKQSDTLNSSIEKKSFSARKSPNGSSSSDLRAASLVSEISNQEGMDQKEPPGPIDLSSAVIGFSNCLAAHMTQIADTAIKLSWDNKAVRRQARHDLRNAPRERSNSDASIGSSDVSMSINEDALPTMHSSRSTFRKVGNAILSFIKKFKDTQIFCHYCQLEREKQAAIDLKINENDNGSLANSPRMDTASIPDAMEGQEPHLSNAGAQEGKLQVSTDFQDIAPFDQQRRHIEAEGRGPDHNPVEAIFSIMLSGTIALDKKQLQGLSKCAELLYAEMYDKEEIASCSHNTIPLTPPAANGVSEESYSLGHTERWMKITSPDTKFGASDVHPSSWNPFVSPPPAAMKTNFHPDQGRNESDNAKNTSSFKKNAAQPGKDDSADADSANESEYNAYMNVREDILFCNGRCGGRMDTALCTEICCQVWQEQAETVQRMMEAREILLQMQGHNSVASTRIETRSGRVIKIPPLPSMKQIRETNSQFELRLKLIKKDGAKRMTDMRSQKHSVKSEFLKSVDSENIRPTDNGRTRQNKFKKPNEKVSNSVPITKSMPTATLRSKGGSKQSTVSESSKAIARYYRKVERTQRYKRTMRAIEVINRHVYAYVQSRRLAKLMQSITLTQAVVRGFLVRYNLSLLDDLLRQRNFMLKVARRKFRVWLQFVANSRRTRALKRASATSTISAASATSSQEADAKRAMVVSPTPSVRSSSPMPSRFADITNAVANALGAGTRRSPKAGSVLVVDDPFESRSSPRHVVRSDNTFQSSSSTLTTGSVHPEDAATFKLLRESDSFLSEDTSLSSRAKFQKINQLTVTTGGGDGSFQGINSSLLQSKSHVSGSTPGEPGGRRSPSNMSQFSVASVSSVMDDVLKMKQRMSSGNSRSRNPTPRVTQAEDESSHYLIPDILSKVATSPSNRTQKPFSRNSSREETEEDYSAVLPTSNNKISRSGSGDEAIVYDYFEHVDIDQEIDDLQNDMTRSAMESNENKWSSDALGSDTSSAFRKQQGIKKPSPLTRHSGQGLKIAPGVMMSIPETDIDNESLASMTPRDPSTTPRSPVDSRKKILQETSGATTAENKDGSPSAVTKRVSSQMKSLQDTLEEVLKSDFDNKKQWEEIGSGSFVGGNSTSGRAAAVTNTVSSKTKVSANKKIARKRSQPAPINVESLTRIVEADARIEMGRASEDSTDPPGRRKSNHHRVSSDVSISAMSDDSSGFNPSTSPLPALVAEAMGFAQVKELLTIQQQRSIRALYDLLRRGVNVMKHGRTGRPKLRRLFCDEALQNLFWREVDSHSNVRKSIDSRSVLTTGSTDDEDNATRTIENTAAEAEVKGMKKRRSSLLRFGHKDDNDRIINIRDILEVTDDLSAEVMQRSMSRQPYTLGPHQDVATCVISLVLKSKARTFDFEIDEKSWNILFHSLRILVNFHQVEAATNSNEL